MMDDVVAHVQTTDILAHIPTPYILANTPTPIDAPGPDSVPPLYAFDSDVDDLMESVSEIIEEQPSMARAVAARTRLFNTACLDLLFRASLWSLPMFMVISEFLACRTLLFHSPLPEATLLFSGSLEYLHSFPPEITSIIMSYMSILTLRTLGQTCRFYHKVVDDLLTGHVSRVVRPFGVPFEHLRFVLDATESVISGSVGLLALFPSVRFPILFQPGDLDIYTTRTQYTHLIRFFAMYAGYYIDTSAGQEYFRLGMILRVFRLCRVGSIIVSLSDNAMMPVFKFHSSLVMNFITGRGVFSAYIETTTAFWGVINSSVFNLKTPRSVRSLYNIIQKYQTRGFTLLDVASDMAHPCTVAAFCPSTIRSTMDSASFFMKFQSPVIGSKPANRVWNPRDVLVWALGGVACPGRGLGRIAGFVRKSSPAPAMVNYNAADIAWKRRMARLRGAPSVRFAVQSGEYGIRVTNAEMEIAEEIGPL